MKVFRSKFSGFCPGVFQAEKKIFEALGAHTGSTIYVLGYLIHNQTYIDHLGTQGVVTVERPDDVPHGELLVIRTHGLQKQVEASLRRSHQVLDLTCPKVKKVQLEIEKHAQQGYHVVITGKLNHPEVQGLLSYATGSTVIEKEADIHAFLENFPAAGIERILVISQTTGERELFDSVCRDLEDVLGAKAVEVKVHDSICSITSLREQDALLIQKSVDVTFVIGDRMSSNASKLFKILAERDERTYFVNSVEELRNVAPPLERWTTAQVVSSSSTPNFVEREIVEYLESI